MVSRQQQLYREYRQQQYYKMYCWHDPHETWSLANNITRHTYSWQHPQSNIQLAKPLEYQYNNLIHVITHTMHHYSEVSRSESLVW